MPEVNIEIERFKAKATRAGAIVYEAEDVDSVTSYILKLAQEHGVKHVVKSKSALADELGLRQHLEKASIEVIETDLRDWLDQVAENRQSEWKSLEQLAVYISRATGEKLEPEPLTLLNAVCRVLRQACRNADLGISEADIAIAETGTLVLTGSEGNARLVAVLPRLHLTLVNCQNIVPTMEDAVLRIKPHDKSTVFPGVPSYVTYITGRNTTADIPGAILARAQGPAEEHILLVSSTKNDKGV